MLFKIIAVAALLAIVYTLASSFVFMVRDKGQSDRTVRRLSWRIGLSLALLGLLALGFEMGWVQPHGYQPATASQQPSQ